MKINCRMSGRRTQLLGTSAHLTAIAIACCLFGGMLLPFFSTVALAQDYYSDESGRYIIIVADQYYSTILPFADWKHKKGMEVEIARLSEIGSTDNAIKNYIQDAYDNWTSRPDYVLLVGDTELLPTHYGATYSDDWYVQLSGGDYLIDIPIGRFSCDNVSECETIVAKHLGYEHDPYLADPDWFSAGTIIVREDYDSSDEIYLGDMRFIHGLMGIWNFSPIDTLKRSTGHDYQDVIDAVDDGRSLVGYRGQGVSNWWSPFDVNPANTSNGWMLPIVVSGTCGTGSFYGDGYACEPWVRAGTSTTPKGAVSFVATSAVVTGGAHLRSVVVRGFFDAVLEKRMDVGTALKSAKNDFYNDYPSEQHEYEAWNVLGDPELLPRTAYPQLPSVSFPEIVQPGPSDFTVQVQRGVTPVPNVLVCAYLPGEVYEYGYTSSHGVVTLAINPVSLDTMYVTVTGKELRPYEGYALVSSDMAYLAHSSNTMDDTGGGNSDGHSNPGETIDFYVELENIGTISAYGVTAKLRTPDPAVTITDSTASYGDIAPDSLVTNSTPFVFQIADTCSNGKPLAFTVFATDDDDSSWVIAIPPSAVTAAELLYSDDTIDDSPPFGNGDAEFDAGETAHLTVEVENTASADLSDVTGTLRVLDDTYLAVTDSTGAFGSIAGLSTGSNGADAFAVSISPITPPGYRFDFELELDGSGSSYPFNGEVSFSATCGGSGTEEPTGPDSYGYYAYDTSDTASGRAPSYDWFEIGPSGPGTVISAITDADAATTTLTLPFTFRYYGTDYSQISVCSNGFVALGTTSYRFGDNSQIPDTHGPAAMVAGFWDDLDPSYAGDIYQYYDSANHRWIVQFDAVVHYGGSYPETFQTILYDPVYHTTETGDGEIVCMYQTVSNGGSNTLGIENSSQNDGIEYVYNGSYAEGAAALFSTQAIKFTTNSPIPAEYVWLLYTGDAIDDSTHVGNGDGAASPGEAVEILVTFNNTGNITAENVTAVLSTPDPDANVIDSLGSYGSIPAGMSADNAADPFRVSFLPEPSDSLVEFDVVVTADGGYQNASKFLIQLVEGPVGIRAIDPHGTGMVLRDASPNPFSRQTRIAYELPAAADVKIQVFNAAGQLVKTIADGHSVPGRHSVIWDGRTDDGSPVASGLYFCRFVSDREIVGEKKVMLLR